METSFLATQIDAWHLSENQLVRLWPRECLPNILDVVGLHVCDYWTRHIQLDMKEYTASTCALILLCTPTTLHHLKRNSSLLFQEHQQSLV